MRTTTVLLLALALSSPAGAFVCLRADNGSCLHWAQGQATLTSFLGTPPTGALWNGTLSWDQNSINAANDWNVAGAAFQFSVQVGGQLNEPCGPRGFGHACPNTGPAGDNPIVFRDSFCGGSFGPDIIELTNDCWDATGAMINAPVFVNSSVPWNAYDGPLQPPVNDIRRVLLHEFGHVLGLGHPDQANPPQNVTAIMNSGESDIYTLQPDDKAGIRFLYPNLIPLVVSGTCMEPGPQGLVPCTAGTVVTAYLCTDRSCGTLTALEVTQTDANGQFSFVLDAAQVAGKRLVFDATIVPAASALTTRGRAASDTTVDLQTIDFGPTGAVTNLSELIDPTSEAAVQLVDDNGGAQRYSDQGIKDVILAVRTADSGINFAGLTAADAVALATETARNDPTVQAALQMQLCAGDCNDNGTVTVDEILTMVNIALGNAHVDDCLAGDVNGDGQITVDEILRAVNNALNGCDGCPVYPEVRFRVQPVGQSTFSVDELDAGGVQHTFPEGTTFTAISAFDFYFENAPPPYTGTFSLLNGGDITVTLFVPGTTEVHEFTGETSAALGITQVRVSSGPTSPAIPAPQEIRFDVCVPLASSATCSTTGDAGVFGLPIIGSVGDASETHLLNGFTPSIYFLEGAQDSVNAVFRLAPTTGQTLVARLFINGALEQTHSGINDVIIRQDL